MDRNLTERLKRLSKELTETRNATEQHAADYTDAELDTMFDRIDAIQDEIWDIEDQLRDEAESEYDEHSAKGWN